MRLGARIRRGLRKTEAGGIPRPSPNVRLGLWKRTVGALRRHDAGARDSFPLGLQTAPHTDSLWIGNR